MNSAIIRAIRERRRLHLAYDGYHRTVEPHAYGMTNEGQEIMRVWQVSGGSVSGERVGWKLLRLDETRGLSVLDETFQGPRRGYKRGDKAMQRIVAQL